MLGQGERWRRRRQQDRANDNDEDPYLFPEDQDESSPARPAEEDEFDNETTGSHGNTSHSTHPWRTKQQRNGHRRTMGLVLLGLSLVLLGVAIAIGVTTIRSPSKANQTILNPPTNTTKRPTSLPTAAPTSPEWNQRHPTTPAPSSQEEHSKPPVAQSTPSSPTTTEAPAPIPVDPPTLPPALTNPPTQSPAPTVEPTPPPLNDRCWLAHGPLTINGAPREGILPESSTDATATTTTTTNATRTNPNRDEAVATANYRQHPVACQDVQPATITTTTTNNNNDPWTSTLWYTVTGGDEVLRANTCFTRDRTTNTRIIVYQGECLESTTTTSTSTTTTTNNINTNATLICIAANDDYCHQHASVSWYAQKGIVYRIAVQGSPGITFRIRVAYEDNSACETSIGPFRPWSIHNNNNTTTTTTTTTNNNNNHNTTLIMGSMRPALLDMPLLTCSLQYVTQGHVWYSIRGTGGWLMASTCHSTTQLLWEQQQQQMQLQQTTNTTNNNNIKNTIFNTITNFDARVDVLATSCESGQCPAVRDSACAGMITATSATTTTTTSTLPGNQPRGTSLRGRGYQIAWLSEPDEMYYILVFKTINLPGSLFTLTVQGFEPVDNDECTAAIPIPTGGGRAVPIRGTTRLATHDVMVEEQISSSLGEQEACGEIPIHIQPGVWYSIIGTGETLLASTCHTETNYASQISVFTGSCNALQCIPTRRQFCGERASVYFDSFPGMPYLIWVHGADYGPVATVGEFAITVQPFITVENDSCTAAIPLTPGPTTVINGSNFMATVAAVPSCDGIPAEAPGVWYVVQGTGTVLRASTCNPETTFDTKISIYQGENCDSLRCVIADDNSCGIQSSVHWTARVGVTYYIYVHGRLASSVGDFALDVQPYNPTFVNDFCDGAVPLTLNDAAVVNGTTRTAYFDNAPTCRGLRNSAPGVWYTVNGTGTMITANLCHPETNYNSALSIYRGPCEALDCVVSNEDGGGITCGRRSQVSWVSQPDELYYILVHGYDVRTGDFGITVEETISTVENDFCVQATPLSIGGGWVMGTTVGATVDAALDCLGVAQTGAGVWYTVRGNGRPLVVSTCHEEAQWDSKISIYTGNCGTLTCLRADDNGCGMQSRVVWNTRVGVTYYILVHGNQEGGDFMLSLEYFVPLQPNDACENAIGPIFPNEKVTFGSTIGSSFDDMMDCGVSNVGPGVWYFVFGSGERLTAETCHQATNFDTKLSIFSGIDCRSLTCVDGNDDGCGLKSSLSWDTNFGELYWVLIHGWGANSVGDFGLTVSGSEIFRK